MTQLVQNICLFDSWK